MKTLQEKLPVFLWKTSPSGDLYYGNTAFSHYSGSNFEEKNLSFYGSGVFSKFSVKFIILQICFEEDIPKLEKSLEISRQKKIAFELKVRLRSKTGIIKWFHISGSPIIDSDGNISNFYGICLVRMCDNLIMKTGC